jgi:hypothetical protein
VQVYTVWIILFCQKFRQNKHVLLLFWQKVFNLFIAYLLADISRGLAIIRAYSGRKFDIVLKINHYHLLFVNKAAQVTNKSYLEIMNVKLLLWLI